MLARQASASNSPKTLAGTCSFDDLEISIIQYEVAKNKACSSHPFRYNKLTSPGTDSGLTRHTLTSLQCDACKLRKVVVI